MKYERIVSAKFIGRVNRFIAYVDLKGEETVVHVKNTGRCRELLTEGCTVYLETSDKPERKTKYDLIAVEKQRPGKSDLLINMDSQGANVIAWEWLKQGTLFSPNAEIRREVKYRDSRFDFYVEDGTRKAFVEVKGVTLESDGIASFPDAPTLRGIRHLQGLTRSLQDGYEAWVLFIVQMKEIKEMHPNDATHKEFGDALRDAARAGVHILAVDCNVTPDEVVADAFIPVIL